jgi:hypothetical protein
MAVPESHPDNDLGLRAALREGLQAELAQIDPEAGLDRLHARLRADAAHAPVRVATDWRSALRGWFTRWPTALASLVIVLQAGLLGWQTVRPVDETAWRGIVTPGDNKVPHTVLAVRFAPQATVQSLGGLLVQLQATVLSGPDEDGIWRFSVPTVQHKAALSALRAHPTVLDATAR